jgi:hypothetical protein
MPARKAGRLGDAEMVRRRLAGATVRELAEASGLNVETVRMRLHAALGPAYYATRVPSHPEARRRRFRSG